MSKIGGPVYHPINVDTNSTAASGTDQSGAGRGAFGSPSPNTKWLPTVPSDAAKAKRAEAEANGTAITIGKGREEYREAWKHMEALSNATVQTNNQEPSSSSDDSTSGGGDIVAEAAKSSEAALKAEEKHDDEVAARRTQELKDLHQDMQLSTTGTTAPAA